MKFGEGKGKFIESWGKLAIDWGLNRTVGQVHALLLISCNPLCADTIMDELKISRGNTHITLRTLIDWGLAYKIHLPGERKEYFKAEKDLWKVMSQVVKMRKKKELDPMIEVLTELSSVKAECRESEEFSRTVNEIKAFSVKAESALNNVTNTEMGWLMNSVLRLRR
ncbi:MAG TPA: transcriptional regulator [Saprospiraceae bacterium]|nr:transcriptional regulator [Saprospiraceae bacterium]